MKKIVVALASILASAALSSPVLAACSTINPTQPATKGTLSSAPVRQNFNAAYTDINNLLTMFAGTTAPPAPCNGQFWRNTSANPNPIQQWDGTAWVLWGYLNTTTHTFSAAASSTTIVTNAPLTSSFALGVVTLGLSFDTNFALSGSSLSLAPIAPGNMIANSTAALVSPTTTTADAWLKRWCSSTDDRVPYIVGGTWGCLGLLGTAHSWSAVQTFQGVSGTTPLIVRTVSGDSISMRVLGDTQSLQIDQTSVGGTVKMLTAGSLTLGTNNLPRFTLSAVGGLFSEAVTGGDKGIGTVNSAGLYVSGNHAAISASGPVALSATTGNVTCPTCATTAGGNIPTLAQGDLLYSSATNVLSALAKDTNATRYLSNTGTTNNPAWAQVSLTNGVTGTLQAAQMPALTGDVTNSGLATTIANNVVSNAKFRQSGPLVIVGNATNGTANVADIAASGGSGCAYRELSNTIGCGVLVSTAYGANSVGNAAIRQGGSLSIIGRSANSTGNVADIAGTANQFLGVDASGTAVAFRTMTGDVTLSGATSTIGANIVTNAKAAQMAAFTIKMNATGSTANATDSTIAVLTSKASPAAGDEILLADNAAGGALKRATVSSIASAGSVSSLNTFTGALAVTAGNGIAITPSSPNIAVSLSTARQTLPTVSKATTTTATGGFSAAGSGTYTTPANVLWIKVTMPGGGGGGAGGGTGATAGGTGGNTCINTSAPACTSPLLLAAGGAGGAGAGQTSGGAGGGGAGSVACNVLQQAGSTGEGGDVVTVVAGRAGGSTPMFAGAGGRTPGGGNVGSSGVANSGGGAGGGSSSSSTSGTGGGSGGVCVHILQSPAATYAYTVAVGGTAGTAGTGGGNGGVGGTAQIIIEEFYNFLLKRDLEPAANDNTPMWLNLVA